MAEITLAEIFPGASQDSTMVMIPKSALPSLTAIAENRGEQLMAAIVLRAAAVFTEAARAADASRSIVVERGSTRIDRTFDSLGNEAQWKSDPFEFQLFVPYTPEPINADNY